MSKARSFIKYWLLPLIWMVLIFSASGDTKSVQRSSRIIGPLMHWLFPHLSEPEIGTIVTVVRKCAHLIEYAVLAILFWRALRKPVNRDSRPWFWSEAGVAVLLVAIYAASDEIHQSFVPNRQGTIMDVLIDTTGAIFGMLLLWVIVKWRKRRQRTFQFRATPRRM